MINKTKSMYVGEKKYFKFNLAFTVLEIIIVMGILGLVGVVVSNLSTNIISYNRNISSSLNLNSEGRDFIKKIEAELREAITSNNGAYPIEQAGTSSITFYSDIGGSVYKEQVKYYISGTTMKKQVIIPSGNPLVYSSATGTTVSDVLHSIVPTAQIFTYYDANYNGISSTSALSQPVNPTAVRLVKIDFIVDSDSKTNAGNIEFNTQVQLRNLKDN